MSYQSLAIFNSVKDELIFYSGEENISFFRSKKKIHYFGEDLFFYAVKRDIKDAEKQLPLKDIFHIEDAFFEAELSDSTNISGEKILLLAENLDPQLLPNDCNIWNSSEIEELQLVEFDIHTTALNAFPYYFSDSHEVILCETFKEVNIEELLDCEL